MQLDRCHPCTILYCFSIAWYIYCMWNKGQLLSYMVSMRWSLFNAGLSWDAIKGVRTQKIVSQMNWFEWQSWYVHYYIIICYLSISSSSSSSNGFPSSGSTAGSLLYRVYFTGSTLEWCTRWRSPVQGTNWPLGMPPVHHHTDHTQCSRDQCYYDHYQ